MSCLYDRKGSLDVGLKTEWKNMKESTYKVEDAMNKTALNRRLEMFATLNVFGYGSLWFVGENIWKVKLPTSYVQREDRAEHPGICLQNASADGGVHAVAPMLYGSTLHMDREKTLRLVRLGVLYVVTNFTGSEKDTKHKTKFGDFRPVMIEKSYFGRDGVALKDAEKRKNMIRLNKNRKLDVREMDELKRFTRKFISLV